MIAPSKITAAELVELIVTYYRTRCRPIAMEPIATYACLACGLVIARAPAYLSIHTTLFDNCAGSGAVWVIDLPYCPHCDGRPGQDERQGCVHLPTGHLL